MATVCIGHDFLISYFARVPSSDVILKVIFCHFCMDFPVFKPSATQLIISGRDARLNPLFFCSSLESLVKTLTTKSFQCFHTEVLKN